MNFSGCAAVDGPPAGGGIGTGLLVTEVVWTSPAADPGALTPIGDTMVVSPPPRVGAVVLGVVVSADMCPWAPIVWIPWGVCTIVCMPGSRIIIGVYLHISQEDPGVILGNVSLM